MRRESMEEKTAVYCFGNLAYDLGQPRYAEDRYAEPVKQKETPPVAADHNPLATVTMLLGVALGVILLIAALLGQTRMVAVNDEAAELTSEISALRQEQTDLRIQYETTLDLCYTEQYAAKTLGMRQPVGEQIVYTEASMPDKATVLNVRRGRGLNHLWGELVDTVGECFH